MLHCTLEKVIGHRGASAYAPENTLVSFEKALQLGCRRVEFDVMLSSDGEALIFHDERLRRTTNGQGHFNLCTLQYIRSLDAGAWFGKAFRGTRIPTLRETLLWLHEHQMQANIEIKTHHTNDLTIAILEHIANDWPSGTPLPLISSFDYQALRICHEKRPDIPLGLLLDKWSSDWLTKAKAINCFSIHISRRMVTKPRIEEIKANGYAVCVYTVNRRSLAFKLLDWGVDAMFSDYPDLIK